MGLPKQTNYDVVIVGAGASGFVAALEAASRGLTTLVLEKGRTTGGSGNYMDGGLAVNSKLQQAAGEKLDPQAVLQAALSYSHYEADSRIWRNYIRQSPANIDWLQSLGVQFDGILPVGDGMHTMHLYTGRGAQLIHGTLEPKAQAAGAEVVTSITVDQLITDDQQRITGVKATDFVTKQAVTITAKAVILATGGYLNDPELMQTYTNYADRLIPVNSGKNTGDGLKLAWQVGARRYRMGTAQLFGGQINDQTKPAYLNWQTQLNGAASQQALLWVNQTGQRFVNEFAALQNFAEAGNALSTQAKVYSILSQNNIATLQQHLLKEMGTWSYPDDKLPDLMDEIQTALTQSAAFITKADTIDALADQLGLPDLPATVAAYNTDAQAGVDADFGKPATFMLPVDQGPYYAIELGNSAFCTMGGLQIDPQNRVLTPTGQPIPGLYAAGNDAAGVLTGDTYGVNLPGTESGFTIYSGRNAAQQVQQYVTATTVMP
ncbi:FAD-dependent oxidoreductase [Lactiplantibacillus daowaiensis]|uniref:FAD-dependent oxidoreductase n=1 Tax=Lactiplantibacillus daowaiensis TaxID=2559918 RepID=A0ABW1S4V7_9LACO|nr:FAD-dependent oxidoreductase [Lactiplantibacillus daowaiensis]